MSAHVEHILEDYVDGSLELDERLTVERHLAECASCRKELEAIRSLVAQIGALPKSIEPERDLWTEIAPRLSREPVPERKIHRLPLLWMAAAAVVAVISVGIALYLSGTEWEVVTLEGTLRVAERPVQGEATVSEGEWLETDETSRARLAIGAIGHVEVAPRTSIQIRSTDATDHRLALARGSIEASIFAPPRLFFVETPSATAVDLGCVYSLSVDSTGTSVLHVKSGYVELVEGARVVVVPAGWMCLARPGKGPGTAFRVDASAELRESLSRFDAGEDSLVDVLALTGPADGVTLWHLFERVPESDRAAVYDRLASIEEAPRGVTRAGVLALDPEMVFAWKEKLGLNTTTWWGYLKKKTAMR